VQLNSIARFVARATNSQAHSHILTHIRIHTYTTPRHIATRTHSHTCTAQCTLEGDFIGEPALALRCVQWAVAATTSRAARALFATCSIAVASIVVFSSPTLATADQSSGYHDERRGVHALIRDVGESYPWTLVAVVGVACAFMCIVAIVTVNVIDLPDNAIKEFSPTRSELTITETPAVGKTLAGLLAQAIRLPTVSYDR
jgi:hypothetical protein